MSAVGRLHASTILWIDELLQKAPATAMHQIEAAQPDDLVKTPDTCRASVRKSQYQMPSLDPRVASE